MSTTKQVPVEGTFLIKGLTPGTSYTWDAAYAKEEATGGLFMVHSGPNNAVAYDAWGMFAFEIWSM